MEEGNPEIGKTVSAAGIATNVHDLGNGDPLLLIHGSGPGVSAYVNWRLSLPTLSQKFRVVAPDVVGFGFTERPDGFEYSLDNWVRHIIGVMDALKIDRAHLTGNSFGGALALALAIRHPDRVNRLVLMGSVGGAKRGQARYIFAGILICLVEREFIWIAFRCISCSEGITASHFSSAMTTTRAICTGSAKR